MSLYSKLYDWQKKIVDKYCRRKKFGLFLDMGLGKTPISLAFAEKNDCQKILIITLNNKATEDVNTGGSWLQWSSKMNRTYVLNDKNTKTFDINANDVFVTNYESLFVKKSNLSKRSKSISLHEKIENFISSCKNTNVAVIIDESHKLKSSSSKQSKAVLQILKKLDKRNDTYLYLLTGTPFTTSYYDLLNQLNLLGLNMTNGDFKDYFCEIGNVRGLLGWQQPVISFKNVELLYEIVHEVALTIKSEEVLDLPDKIFLYNKTNKSEHFDMITQEKIQNKTLQTYCKKRKVKLDEDYTFDKDTQVPNPFYRNIAYPNLDWFAETVGTYWLRCRQLSIGFQGNSDVAEWYDKSRLNTLYELLKTHQNNYIIFYNYTPELFEIYDVCNKLNYNIDVYCGPVKSLYFYEKYENQTQSERLTNTKNIILANFASGSAGKNWQLYNTCIMFSIPLYSHYEQALKRIHRIGTKETVTYHMFLQNNWLDKRMMKALQTREEYNEKLFAKDLKDNL